MPPNTKKGKAKADVKPAKGAKPEKKDNVDEAPLQAVILADSYNRRFEVLCSDTPRILLPLCSASLLSYTLEALDLSKVKQVFIFCGPHADQVRAYVAKSAYTRTMDIQCLSSQTARSAGDALRELDGMGVLNGENPFILVHSPLVSNYDMTPMIEAHKKRREADKNFIMTMGVGRGGMPHPESAIMLVHPPSRRLLHYTLYPLAPSMSRINMPSTLFSDPFPVNIDTWELWGPSSKHSEVPGYRDIGIDICEADVPALCTENFDYHDLRRHFVNGVLTSELLGKKIAVHVVGEEENDAAAAGTYVGRIRDTRTFGEVALDVLRRYAYPFMPDVPHEPNGTQYELRRGMVYIAKDEVKLSRTTVLEGPLLIGPRSTLNNHTLVRQSTLGADCSVSPNTSIILSFIYDEARIGANCMLQECIVGKDVHIADGVEIGRGAVLGNGVRLGKGAQVPEYARVGKEKWRAEYDDEDDDEDDEHDETEEDRLQREKIVGKDGVGYLWPQEEEVPADDSDDEGEDPFEHPSNRRLLQLGRPLPSKSESGGSLSTLSAASSSASQSVNSDDSELPDVMGLSIEAGEAKFKKESYDTIDRAWEEGHSVDNALVEYRLLIKGLNADWEFSRKQVVNYMLSKVDISSGVAKILSTATSVFTKWGDFPLQLAPHPSKPGQNEPLKVVLDVQERCVDQDTLRPYFGILLRAMYEAELVDEDGLIRWRGLKRSQGDGLDEETEAVWKEVWAKGKAYVDALEDMESDSDEDEDEEEEDEEE